MKASERDVLIGRIDERTRNTYTLVEKQEKHLSELNGSVRDHSVRLTALESGVPIKIQLTKNQTGVGVTGVATLVTAVVVAIGNLMGWW